VHQHNLPTPRTPLIGRQHDVAAVRQVVLDPDRQVVTLTGAGGCGKTRLALQVGIELVDAFLDGVWFVELAPLMDPSLVPHVVATALGLPQVPDRPAVDTLVQGVHGRHMLIVLDNCEHLVEACAWLADRLLAECPRLRILATSREALRIASEVGWPVAPLAVPDARRTPSEPAEAAHFPSVQLFVERARSAQPTFVLTADNTAAVAQICVRLDGLPLALELAAARARVLTAEQIAARLNDVFRVLTDGNRTAPNRQQTLRATFDWSDGLLNPAERALFRRLAVFAGGWTLEAAEAICAGDGIAEVDVLELLGHFVDRSLVVAEATPTHRSEMRYRLLEPTRQYAFERLQAEAEDGAAHRRHTAYFLALAKPGEEDWRGSKELAWLERIEREQDNLRVALGRSLEHGDIKSLLLLSVRLTRFWEVRGHLQEGQKWLTDGLERAADVPPVLRMRAVGRAMYLANHAGAYDRQGLLSDEWLALARELGDAAAEAEATMYRGGYFWAEGDFDAAVPLYEEVYTFWRTRDDPINLGAAMMNLGWLLLERGDVLRGDVVRARKLFDEQVRARAGRDHIQEGIGLAGLGFLAYLDGEWLQAVRLGRQALALAQEIGHKSATGFFLNLLAIVAAAEGKLERAGRLFGARESVLETIHARQVHHDVVLRAHRERLVAAARSGPESTRFSAALAAGRALSLNQAVAYALADEEPRVSGAAAVRRTPGPAETGLLSRRELEVTSLVALGLSNRQIAAKLVITERTAGAHVEHILDKLGFATRTQIGVWASEHGIVAPQLN
jgi:non-specific serine/threonine protein kinase